MTAIVLSDDLSLLIDKWLASKAPTTQAAYRRSLGYFAASLGVATPEEAIRAMLESPGAAYGVVSDFRDSMIARGLSPNSVNARKAAVESVFSELCKRRGLAFRVRADDVKKENSKPTTVVTWTQFEEMRDGEPDPRRRALLSLLGDRGLRLDEALSLEYHHWQGSKIMCRRKGSRVLHATDIPPGCVRRLEEWAAVRGSEPGPLIGLRSRAAYEAVRTAGRRVGIDAHPHALRKTFAFRLGDLTNGNVEMIQLGLHHANLATTLRYLPQREDELASVIARVT